jgi:hypothetical protein
VVCGVRLVCAREGYGAKGVGVSKVCRLFEWSEHRLIKRKHQQTESASCDTLYSTAMLCYALDSTVHSMYCTIVCSTVLYCAELYCTVTTVTYCTVLHCNVLYGTVAKCVCYLYGVRVGVQLPPHIFGHLVR